MARAAAPEFPVVFRRAEHIADRDLDDAAGDQLAGLPADRLGVSAGHRGIFRANTDILAGAVCGSVGGPAEPAARFDRDAGAGDAAIVCAGVSLSLIHI